MLQGPSGTARIVSWEPVSLSTPAQKSVPAKHSTPAGAASDAGTIDAWIRRTETTDTTSASDDPESGKVTSLVVDMAEEMPAGGEELMRWDVSAGDFGGMRQVEVNSNKEVKRYLPLPLTHREKVALAGFGQELHYGVILRIRKIPIIHRGYQEEDEDIECRLVGALELPDFNAEVLIEGHYWRNGTITFEEKKLLCGPAHATWVARFGQAEWRPGTTYELHTSRSTKRRLTRLTHISGAIWA